MLRKPFLYSVMLGFLLLSCNDKETSKEITPVGVETLTIGNTNNESSITSESYPGTIQAEMDAQLSFQVSGDVNKIHVNIGDYVEKGSLIANIDPTTYVEQYEAQQAQADLAEENYTRINEVYKKGSIAEIRMIEARSNFKQAQSAANAAYQNVKKTKLRAPFSGYIGNKMMETGDVASPGKPVVELLDMDQVQAIISLSDKEVNTYKVGDSATVTVSALDKKFTGVLTEIAVQSGRQNPVYKAKITIPNPDKILKPGMACQTSFNKSTNKTETENNLQSIVLPVQVVSITDEGQNFVYVVDTEKNTAQRKFVEIGTLYNDGIAIEKGLQKGDVIITSGYHKLTNNTPVKVLSK
ncbi:efflux RND transporter periplasmic adaptor subunit [uncultured Marixanthomonas sp.]|uniref:efflux RND transporter periplasmic adaptor subunit n=1 Tax=uncultured Marixanthomonas sp. TaxID=757245 RepID=UPI0030D9B742